ALALRWTRLQTSSRLRPEFTGRTEDANFSSSCLPAAVGNGVCTGSCESEAWSLEAEVRCAGTAEQYHDLRTLQQQRHEDHDRRSKRSGRQVAVVVHDNVR